MSSQDVIQDLRACRSTWEHFGVSHLWLFGSRARGDATDLSDWDVLVEFSKVPGFRDFMSLKFFLEDRLGGSVDVVSRGACSARFLNAIQPDMIDVA